MSRSDKNWKNSAMRVIEAEPEEDISWGMPLQDVLHVGTIFTHKSRSYQINRLEECEGQWRTHVHINGTHCFDIRTLVKTKN